MSDEQCGAGLRPARGADRAAPHHAGLRQHAAHGRARGAPLSASASARSTSPRITAAWPRSCGSTPSSGSSAASSRCWSRPPRSNSASTSATSTSSASSARRARSPRFLQRVGRSGHASAARRRGGCSRCRATSWSNARRCSTASGAASSTGCAMPDAPLDVLAQQIVAEVAAARVGRGRAVRAGPPRLAVPRAAARGFRRSCSPCSARASARGAAGAARCIHHDAVNHAGCARARGARLTALTSGGTIPDNADYRVLLEPESHIVGTRQRGFRGREPRRRRLPARQHLLSHPARRARRRARRGRARPAAHHPVLARRSAGPQRRAVAGRLAPARRDRWRAWTAMPPATRPRHGSRREIGLAPSRREAAGRISRRGPRGARLPADAGHASSSSASSMKPAACSW